MTQRTQILDFLSDNLGKGFTARQLQKKLNFKFFSSLRGRLSELKKDGDIESRKSQFFRRLEYFIEEAKQWIRKIVKASFKKTGDYSPYALTYEQNKTDRAKWLIEKISTERRPYIKGEKINKSLDDGIKNFKPKIAVFALSWGYDQNQTDSNPPKRLRFEKYEAGIE